MKSKPAVGLLVLVAVGLTTWSLTTAIAGVFMGGREEFLDWRADNTALFYGIWLAEVIVIGLPLLWVVGKRIDKFTAQQDKTALEARGVGRLAGQALRGDKKSIDHLVKLLDDPSPAVRYQSARALALLDDKATDEELFRKVRYWDGEHKLGLIDVLRRTMDMRTIKLLRMLCNDRNPMVARKAKTGLAIVSSRSRNMDDFIAKRRQQAQAKTQKAAAKSEKSGAARPSPVAGPEEPVEAGAADGSEESAGSPAPAADD